MNMEHNKSRRTLHVSERVSHTRSPSPEYFVDLTVDSPLNLRNRSPVRREGTRRISRNNRESETPQVSNEQVIACSNRHLPPKKRTRIEKEAKPTTVVDLDNTVPEEVARINDSTSGEPNVLTCPICFEYLTSKRKPTSTRCGHVYCYDCIMQTFTMSKKCPKCQATMTQKSCIRLYF